jgi:putative hemolysin
VETIWIELTLIVVAILANGFFAGAEIAIVSSRVARLNELVEQGARGAAAALRLKEAPEAFLATIQVAITLVGTLASAVGGATAIEALTPWLAALPLAGARVWAEPVALGLVIVAITVVSLVIGELTPKALALRDPERLASRLARPVERLSRLAAGPVVVLTTATRGVLRLLGVTGAAPTPETSEEEVRYLLRAGAARGIFRKVEEELVHNVFEFADRTVRQVMVPRARMLGLEVGCPPERVLADVVAIGHARVPVYRGSIEQPVGVVIIKDLLGCAARGEPPVLARLLHPPLFVPETALISGVLRQFQRTQQSLAIAVDEYGGVVGLVTLEDILEEIVGEIREEREPAGAPWLTRLADGSWVVDAAVPVADARERLSLPLPDSPEYQTLAGYLIHALQSIPAAGASVTVGEFRLTVVDVEGPRIARVKVQRRAAG